MRNEAKTTKQQKEDKVRCAQFLLEMIEKYGAEILEEQKRDESDSK